MLIEGYGGGRILRVCAGRPWRLALGRYAGALIVVVGPLWVTLHTRRVYWELP